MLLKHDYMLLKYDQMLLKHDYMLLEYDYTRARCAARPTFNETYF